VRRRARSQEVRGLPGVGVGDQADPAAAGPRPEQGRQIPHAGHAQRQAGGEGAPASHAAGPPSCPSTPAPARAARAVCDEPGREAAECSGPVMTDLAVHSTSVPGVTAWQAHMCAMGATRHCTEEKRNIIQALGETPSHCLLACGLPAARAERRAAVRRWERRPLVGSRCCALRR